MQGKRHQLNWPVGLAILTVLVFLVFYLLSFRKTEVSALPALAIPQASQAAKSEARRLQENFATERAQLMPPDAKLLAEMPRSPLADTLANPPQGTVNEAEVVYALVEYYRREFKAVPAGEGNRQIVNALRGANPGRIPILPGDHPRLSASGELLDAWGKPFAFHQISREEMEVRSAGADGNFYTGDDWVAGKK